LTTFNFHPLHNTTPLNINTNHTYTTSLFSSPSFSPNSLAFLWGG